MLTSRRTSQSASSIVRTVSVAIVHSTLAFYAHTATVRCTVGMKLQLDRIDAELCGKVEDEAIFELQAQWYREHIFEPLRRHEPDTYVPELTADDCRRHYTLHSVNPRRMLKNDIQFLDNAQRFLQKNGILNKNRSSGKLNMNMSFLKQWNVLSRNKLDLLRYYRQEYAREEEAEVSGTGPTEFSSF